MAQKLKFGNGTWATKKGSTLSYNDEGGNYKPLPFTTTRNSIATRVNKEGLIEVVGNDIPRIDYTDSAEGVLLLEDSSTNLITYSEAFDNSYWTKSGSSATSGFISPSGDLSAFKLVENIDTVEHYIKRSIANPIGFYTWSLFVKAGERKYIVFRTNADGGAYKNACFDVESGTIVYDGLHQSKAEIQSFNNGWFRVSAYVKETSGTTRNYQIHISDSPITDNGAISYTGDGISGVYVYGAMLELSAFATSYIPTNGSTVTRQADTASGAGNSQVFNDSQGVLFANIAANSDTTTVYNSIGIGSNSPNNRISIGFDSSSNPYVFKRTTSQWLSSTSNNIKLYNKIAISYNTNDNHFWLNGFKIDSNTTIGDLSTKPYELGFEATFGGNNFYGKTKEIGYYDEILTDLELEYLTSYRSLNELVTELNLNEL